METMLEKAVPDKTDEEYQSAIDQFIAAMKNLREEMTNDQREIEALRAETRVILSQMKGS